MAGDAYDVHPYMLLNYNDNYESVSTLAHEGGHAIHSYLTTQNQPFLKSDYPIFTAEIASTFNEVLMLEHSLNQAQSDDERLYYLGHALENMRGTFFRQTMFAEFELAIHEEVEKGNPLTGEKLSIMYGDLLRRYHGDYRFDGYKEFERRIHEEVSKGTVLAEFESEIHAAIESRTSLTEEAVAKAYGEVLGRKKEKAKEKGEDLDFGKLLHTGEIIEIFRNAQKVYEGRDVLKIDDLYAVEWAYIPHFYRNFYVYQYATSIAASSPMADAVLNGREGALETYLGLLKAGGSDYAYDLVKRAGVDLATPAPYQSLIARMNKIMDEIEKILDGRG